MPAELDVEALSRNVPTALRMRVLLCAWAHIPTLLLFYEAHGLRLSDVFLLKSALSVLVLVLEVPSGYFADRVGRSSALRWGGVLWLLAMATFVAGSSFNHFLVAELVLGAGISLISGADSALLFDTLKCLKREHEYKKIEGRVVSASGFSEAFFGVIGAGLASFDLSYPFYLQGALVSLYLLTALKLQEPPRTRLTTAGVGMLDLLSLCKTVLLKRPRLRLIMLFSGFSSTGTLSIVWFSQSYMQAINLPVAAFGFVWALLHCFERFRIRSRMRRSRNAAPPLRAFMHLPRGCPAPAHAGPAARLLLR